MIRERLGCCAVETFFFLVDAHSFALRYLRKLLSSHRLMPKLVVSRERRRSWLYIRFRRSRLAASWFSLWPEASNHLLSASAAEDRTRPIPYASMTLSGSRNGKRTHLCVGESNSCPGSGRSFLQSRSSGFHDALSWFPFASVTSLAR